jgi:hypothetical protein
MIENERSTAIAPSEAVEEKVSLSDRFGLWLGFHPCSQDEYLAMIRGYCDAFGIGIGDEELRAEAIEWQATRGARSGRVAWQFVTDLAGRRGARRRAGFSRHRPRRCTPGGRAALRDPPRRRASARHPPTAGTRRVLALHPAPHLEVQEARLPRAHRPMACPRVTAWSLATDTSRCV